MNEDLAKLFQTMQAAGFIPADRTFEQFSSAMAEPAKQQELYGFLKSQNMTLPPMAEFQTRFFTGIEKKNPVPSSQEQSTASSTSSSTSPAPAPIADTGLNIEPIARESTAAPQVIQRDLNAPFDPDKIASKEDIVARIQGKQTAFKPDLSITGKEDPVTEGEKIRAGKDQAYDYRKKYSELSDYRKEKRAIENAAMFGKKARMQAGVANDQLKMKYGDNWLDQLTELGKQLEGATPENATPQQLEAATQYNKIVSDEYFQTWQNAQIAGENAYNKFKELSTTGVYAKTEGHREANTLLREQKNSLVNQTVDGAVRTGAQLLGSLVALPRTLARSTGLIAPDQFTGADMLGSMGDSIKEWADVWAPKQSKFEQAVFEKRVPYEGYFVVVDENGEPTSVRDKNGNRVNVFQSFLDDFKKSGKAAEAKSEFTGASNVLDKTAGVVTDLLIMRYLGGGTKAGTMLSSFGMMHQQAFDEAIQDMQMDPNDAAQYAALTSAVQGAIEAYVGDIETNLGKTGRLAKPLTAKQLKPLVGKMSAGELAVARMAPVLKEVGGENLEEVLQQISDSDIKGRFNAETGAQMDNNFSLDDFKQLVSLTTLATGLAGSTQALTAVDDMKRRAILSMTEDMEKFKYALAQLQENGAVSPERAQVMNERAQAIMKYNSTLPKGLSEDQRSAALAKEWNRMELTQRSQNKEVLPAQADEAKQAANSLKGEIIKDIQPQPEEETQEVSPESETEKPEASTFGQIGNLRIAAEEPAQRQEPIKTSPLLPEAFRQHDPEAEASTAAATAYANQEPASVLADQYDQAPESVGDEIGDIAYQTLKDKGYEPTEQEGGQIRRFFADSMRGQENTPVDEAFNRLADEYIDTHSENGPARKRFAVETIEDQAADFFGRGGKISPQSYDRHGDSNHRKDNSLSGLYFSNKGSEIDQLAHSWADRFGLSEAEATQRIVDFMHQNPTKAMGQYMDERVADQENARQAQADEEMAGEMPGYENLDPEEQKAARTSAREEVNDAVKSVDQETLGAMEAWLSQHTDENGNVSPSKVRQAVQTAELTPLDEGFDANTSSAWDTVPEEGKNIIRKLAAGTSTSVTAQQTAEPVSAQAEQNGLTFEQFTDKYGNDPEAIKEAWDNGAEFTWLNELQPDVYDRVENIVKNGQDTEPINEAGPQSESVGSSSDAQAGETPEQDAGIESTEASEDQNEPRRPRSSDISTVQQVEAEAWASDNLDEALESVTKALQTVQLPDQLSPALVAEMADQGLVTVEEANIITTALNSGQEVPEALRTKAEGQMENLREVPQWLGVFNDAVAERARAVLDGKAKPGEPIFVEHNGEMMVGNVSTAQAEGLRRAGATLRGRAWVFPVANRDTVMAEAFKPVGPGPAQTGKISRVAGSMKGAVSRLFNQKNGKAGLRGMAEAVENSDGVDAKIEAAARHLGPANTAVQIGGQLSKKFGVPVSTDAGEINEALTEMGMPELIGSPEVRGFVWKGKVYLNLDGVDAEVPIHEFGHLWEAAVRGTPVHQQAMDAIRGSKYEAAVRNNPRYQNLSEDEIMAESLALAIGQRGALITDNNAWVKFQDALKGIWMQAKRLLGINVEDMNAREFADYVATMLTEDAPPTVSLLQSEPKAQFLFAGEKAQNMRQEVAENLPVAKEMERQGYDADEIWNATGWFRGVDTAWRYMIGDKQANLKISAEILNQESADTEGRQDYTLADILDHPQLFEEFEQLKSLPVTIYPGEGTFATDKKIQIDPKYAVDNSPNPDSMLTGMILHEAQHIIQKQMGFSTGGNVPAAVVMADQAADMMPEGNPLAERLKKTAPADLYRAIAGEVEARIVQDFQGYDPEELDRAPVAYSDVAPEDQFIIFGDIKQAAEMIAGVRPKPSFLFGRKQVVNAGAMAAAQQIIEDEIKAGKDPAATGTLNKLSKLGINLATAERIYTEVKAQQEGARIVSALGKQAFAEQTWENIKKIFFKYFRVRGLMPRSLFDLNQQQMAAIKGHVYGMQQSLNRLGKAINNTLEVKNDQNRNLIWQQVQNVLEGTQPMATLDPSLHGHINELRSRLDDLTTELVKSGAVGPNMAITMLSNSGVDIQAANADEIAALKKALNKYPSERTQVENDLINDFLNKYGGALGNYLYRSYQANDDPKWKNIVTQDKVDAAKRKLEEMIRGEIQDELDALADKHADLDAQKADLEQSIKDKIDAVQQQANDLQTQLNDVIQQQAQYQADKGKVNKTLQRRELAIAKRLQAIRNTLRQGNAVANLSPADFALLINAPGFNPVALNTLLKGIYSLRKQMMALDERKAKAQTASYARIQYLDKRLGNLDHEIETMLQRDESGGIMTAGKLGSVAQSITQGKRQDIPVEFRDLLGEYRDPRVNLMRSVLRISTALEHQKFLLDVKEAGLRDGWLAPMSEKTGPLTVELASPNSDTMDPLNGMWTTPEIAEIFNTYNHSREIGWMARVYYSTVGAVKIGKTILSTGSQGRNYMSNLFQAVYNGWIGYPLNGQKFEGFLQGMKAFNFTQSPQDAAEFEAMVRAGVLSNSVTAGEIRHMAKLLTDAARGEITGETWITQPKKAYDYLVHVYQASDEMMRIWGFKVEQDRYARAYYGDKYENLTPAQQKIVFDKAAGIIRQITPDYSLIPKIGELLRLNPLTGTFVSWQMEVFRNYFNRLSLIRQEYRDPRTRHIAVSRMLYLALGHGLWAGIAAALAAAAGIGDDEEKAIDPWLKPWQQGTTKWWTSKDEKTGTWTFFNLGYVDPYSFWQKPYSTLTAPNENSFMDKSLDAGTQFLGPIIQPDLVASTLGQVLFNTNIQTGKKIVLPEYGLNGENAHRMYQFIRKRLQPGLLKTATDLIDAGTIGIVDEYGNIKTVPTIAANAIGFNFETVQPKKAFSKYILEQQEHKEAILESFNKVRRYEIQNLDRASTAGLSESQMKSRSDKATERIKEMYDLTDRVYNQHLRDLGIQVVNANKYLGVEMPEIISELSARHYSKAEMAVILGKIDHIPVPLKKVKK